MVLPVLQAVMMKTVATSVSPPGYHGNREGVDHQVSTCVNSRDSHTAEELCEDVSLLASFKMKKKK